MKKVFKLFQVRYAPNDGGKPSILEPQSEADLECPKVGCDWLCTLVFNLPQRPRDFSFDVRAKVEGIWNKWVPIARRYYFPSLGPILYKSIKFSSEAHYGDIISRQILEKKFFPQWNSRHIMHCAHDFSRNFGDYFKF